MLLTFVNLAACSALLLQGSSLIPAHVVRVEPGKLVIKTGGREQTLLVPPTGCEVLTRRPGEVVPAVVAA